MPKPVAMWQWRSLICMWTLLGIVPVACEELFKQIDEKKTAGVEYQVITFEDNEIIFWLMNGFNFSGSSQYVRNILRKS